MLTKEMLEMTEELRQLLGSINVAKKVEENFSLEYLIVVEKEEDKGIVEQVGNALVTQAAQMGFGLEIIAATESELEIARAKLEELKGESN